MPDPQCGPINEPEAEYKAVSVDINFDEVFSHQSDEERIGLFLREHLSEEDATIFEVYMNSDMKSIIDFCRIMADEFEISPTEMKTKILKARKVLRKVSIPDFKNDVWLLRQIVATKFL